MRRLLIAATALLFATPAWADWSTTKWGMTVEQVLNAVPGARPLKREGTGSDVWKQQRLASAPWKEGEIEMVADFFFDPEAHTLSLVKMQPKDVAQCGKLETAMVARYGAGTRTGEDFANLGMALGAIRWVDPKTHERLIYSKLTKNGQGVTYCHVIQQMPL